MSKPWGGVGAWALDAERAEAEERERAAGEATEVLAGQPAGQSFPSLKEAAATKPKKKKGVTVPLAQFVAPGGGGGGGGSRGLEPRGLTPVEMLRLPTGPKERSAEELEYGRGFRSYGAGSRGGGGGGGFGGRRSDDGEGGRRPYGGFDDEPRRGPPSRDSDFDQPSRADEVDNWATGKKSFAPVDSGSRDRYSSLGSGSSSRADDVDNWSATKKPPPSRFPSFGSGFRDPHGPSEPDRWARGGGSSSSGGLLPHSGDRPRLVLDPPKRDASVPNELARNRPSPFGAARPREEVLKEKGLDPRKVDSEIEIRKTSSVASPHSSRPSSAQSSRPGSPGSQAGGVAVEGAPKPRPKANPFGDAKPREVRLQEQGIDWKKLDMELEHRSVDRPETQEEKVLKEEINNLKALLKETEGNLNNESAQFSAEDLASLREQILHKETDLEQLISQLDDKVRFGQRAPGDIRPGSGAGRRGISSDRPPSQSGRSEESRSIEFMDRPRSRGSVSDVWSKPMDDKQGYQGGRERSFLGDRNMNRSKSRERW